MKISRHVSDDARRLLLQREFRKLAIGSMFGIIKQDEANNRIAELQQLAPSKFELIGNVSVDDVHVMNWQGRQHKTVAFSYVSFDYQNKHYDHMQVIGSTGQASWDYFQHAKVPDGCVTTFVDVDKLNTGSEDSDDFKLIKSLRYQHEYRIPKGSFALQTNQYYPSIDWQLEHHQVCLVANY